MSIFLCREVSAFWFVDSPFQSGEGVEPSEKAVFPVYVAI